MCFCVLPRARDEISSPHCSKLGKDALVSTLQQFFCTYPQVLSQLFSQVFVTQSSMFSGGDGEIHLIVP